MGLYGKIRKFQPQIDVCQNLVTFLGNLKPKVRNEEGEDQKHLSEEQLQGMLNSGDWKKEKLHVLKKNDDEDLGLQPGAGKKKRQKNKKQVTEDPKLTLTIETLNFFDSIKVAPPTFLKDIDASIAKINEKKEYFIKLSDEINEKGEEAKKETEKEEEEEKKNEEEKVETQEETKKPKAKKEKIDLDN